MKTLLRSMTGLPVKWKLTLLSALFLFMLFTAYTIVQYIFVEKWMFKQEEMNIRHNMNEVLNSFLEREATFEEDKLASIRDLLQKANRQNQMIRVLDETGAPIVVVTNDIDTGLVQPQAVSASELGRSERPDDFLLIMRSPLTIFEFRGTVEMAYSMKDYRRLNSALLRVMIAFGAGAVVLSALGGLLLARQLLKPVQAMAVTMRNVKQRGLHERMPLSGSQDEFANVMTIFNVMMDQVERSFRQQRQFVEDASHELRTPVAIIEGHLHLLQRWGKHDPAILEESLAASVQELARLKGLVQELLTLTRAEQEDASESPLPASPERVMRMLAKNMSVLHPDCRFEMTLKGLAKVRTAISEQRLEQVLLIVLDNAVKYSTDPKRVHIRGSVREGQVVVEVADSGIGIPAADLPYVTDRFYRVDKARSRAQGGNGLGLAIAKRLLERHSGTIAIASTEGEGTTVSVTLPVSDARSKQAGL